MINRFGDLIFRFAEEKDLEFIIDSIIESDKSISQNIPTCKIFNLSELKWRQILTQILLEDFPDYEFSLSGFLIAELDEIPVCTQCSWIEGKNGKSNSEIKALMLKEFIPEENLFLPPQASKFIKLLNMKRGTGKIQLEYTYTVPELRRRGLHTRVLFEILNNVYSGVPSEEMVQTIFFKENLRTFNQFTKLGFNTVIEKHIDDSSVLEYFPGNTKIMMELSRTKIINSILYLNKLY